MIKISSQNIARVLEESYIRKIFEKKKKDYFPSLKNKKISKIEIERVSPVWYTKTCLSKYKVFFSDSSFKTIRGSARVDISNRKIFEIMRCLYENGFNKGKFQVPRPLDYIHKTNLLLYDEAEGAPLALILEKGQLTSRILKDIAEFLFKLHSFKKIRRRAKIKKLKDYEKTFKRINNMFPKLRTEIVPLKKINFLNDLLEGSSFIHGDFYPGNIIVNHNKIFMIDFDKAGRGSFLEDLSSLSASFEFPKYVWHLNISAKERKKFKQTFLMAYAEAGNMDYSILRKKLKKFSIKTFLKPLYHITDFAWNSWDKIDAQAKMDYFLKIKDLLLKLKKIDDYKP